jgi:hypothetical protein
MLTKGSKLRASWKELRAPSRSDVVGALPKRIGGLRPVTSLAWRLPEGGCFIAQVLVHSAQEPVCVAMTTKSRLTQRHQAA